MNTKTNSATETPRISLASFNATYLVAPDAEPGQLLDDAYMWLESAMETARTVAYGMDDPDSDLRANPSACASLLYGACHLMQMTAGVIAAAQKLANGSGQAKR